MSGLTVNLGENSYDILIDSGILASLGDRCAAVGLAGKAAVITNPTVAALYGAEVERSLAAAGYAVTAIEIPDGEEHKNAATLNSVYDRLIDAGLDRRSFIVALGGGVVGDLAGFAAATYLRGIPFVQVPTTLLAQVDSSVGGKTAIDHPRGKNLIGAFYQPRLVLIDVDTLKTLPPREYKAGLAEVVKYGAVLDPQLFEFLEQKTAEVSGMQRDVLVHVIRRCCELKAQVVELDEKESGLRVVLNYGHTIGHAFETVAGYTDIIHGEAVAMGMTMASRISMALGHCSADDGSRIEKLLSAFGLPVAPPPVSAETLQEAMALDKKSRDGAISFICNQGIGHFVIEESTPQRLLELAELCPAAQPTEPAAAPKVNLPVADGMDADFQAFDEEDEEDILEDLEILDVDEADLVEEDEEEPASDEAARPGDPLLTATVAELYVRQGFVDKALDIYRALAAADPANTVVAARIAELDQSGGPTADQPEPVTTDPAVDVLEGWLENVKRMKSCH